MRKLGKRRRAIIASLCALSIIAISPTAARAVSTSWTASSLNLPTGVSTTELLGVYCKETTACTAVGKDGISGGTGGAFGETMSGSTWTFASSLSRNPGGGSNKNGVLNGVFCTASTTCMAVGSVGTGGHPVPIAEAQSGSSWTATVISLPPSSERAELNGVACKSATECFGPGYKMIGGDDKAMAMSREPLTGGWLNMSGVAEQEDATLKGIDCKFEGTPVTTFCILVGSQHTKIQTSAIEEIWNGTSWGAAAAPAPTGAASPVLNDISCVTSKWCLAVGTYTNSSGKHVPFTDLYNGSSIALTKKQPPTTGATEAAGYGVSCASTTECWVVGEQKVGSALKPWGARWNGVIGEKEEKEGKEEWTAGTFELAPTSEGAQLRDVSCAAVSTCKAVGWSSFGGTHVAVVDNLHP
jgi:hypothetical protein